MGKAPVTDLLPEKSYYRHIGKRAEYPDSYKMNKDGLFIRDTVLDITQVENLFVTPRAYDYYMNRKSSEEWEKEQTKDENGTAPITLSRIEQGINIHTLGQMLVFENGKADYRKMSDIDLCQLIDTEILPGHGRTSVYELGFREKQEIAQMLYRRLHLGQDQIRRCLAMLG